MVRKEGEIRLGWNCRGLDLGSRWTWRGLEEWMGLEWWGGQEMESRKEAFPGGTARGSRKSWLLQLGDLARLWSPDWIQGHWLNSVAYGKMLSSHCSLWMWQHFYEPHMSKQNPLTELSKLCLTSLKTPELFSIVGLMFSRGFCISLS